MLTCALDLSPAGGHLVRIAFRLRNTGSAPVEVVRMEPFADFTLSVSTPERELPVVEPGYNIGVHTVASTLAPGGELTLLTPFRIGFDPAVAPSGGPDPTRWSIVHPATPVRLTARVRLGGRELPQCEAVLDPGELP